MFWGWLDINKIGKGANAYVPAEDNIEREPGQYIDWNLRDRTYVLLRYTKRVLLIPYRNHKERWGMYGDVPNIIHDILKHGAKLAIVSRNKSKPA